MKSVKALLFVLMFSFPLLAGCTTTEAPAPDATVEETDPMMEEEMMDEEVMDEEVMDEATEDTEEMMDEADDSMEKDAE